MKPGDLRGTGAKSLSKKKLGHLCRQYTDEALDFMVAVMRGGGPVPQGAPTPRHVFLFTDEKPNVSERLKAAAWLVERGHGRVPEVVKIEEDRPVREYTDAELVAIIEAGRDSSEEAAAEEVH